ncbi:galactokinase [Chytridiales sp. JEL 0842]|nr:galactokinase [Chytridiales sp. JEL 0842]
MKRSLFSLSASDAPLQNHTIDEDKPRDNRLLLNNTAKLFERNDPMKWFQLIVRNSFRESIHQIPVSTYQLRNRDDWTKLIDTTLREFKKDSGSADPTLELFAFEHYCKVLGRALVEGGQLQLIQQLLSADNLRVRNNVTLLKYLLIYLVKGLCERGEISKALELFWSDTPDGSILRQASAVYEEIIRSALKQKRLADAIEVSYAAMRNNCTLSLPAVDALLSELLQDVNWTVSVDIFDILEPEMQDAYIRRKLLLCACKIYQSHIDGSIVLSYDERQKLDVRIQSLRFDLRASGSYLDLHSYTDLISYYLQRNDIASAEECLYEMDLLGIYPDYIAHHVFISRYITSKSPEVAHVVHLAKSLIDNTPLKKPECQLPTSKALTAVVAYLGKVGESTHANELFRYATSKGLRPDKHLYTTMVSIAANIGDSQLAEVWVEKMIADNIQGDSFTYHALMNAYFKSEQFEKSVNLFNQIVERDSDPTGNKLLRKPPSNLKSIEPSLHMYNILIRCIGRSSTTPTLPSLLNEMKNLQIEPDAVTYFSMMELFCKQKRLDDAMDVFLQHANAWRADPNMKMSNASYYILLNTIGSIGYTITHVEQVVKVMHEFHHSLSPDSMCYAALMQAAGKVGKAEEVLEIWQNIRAEGATLSKSDATTVQSFNIGLSVIIRACLAEMKSSLSDGDISSSQEDVSNEIAEFLLCQVWAAMLDGFPISSSNFALLLNEVVTVGFADKLISVVVRCLASWRSEPFLRPTTKIEHGALKEMSAYLLKSRNLQMLRTVRTTIKRLKGKHSLAVERQSILLLDSLLKAPRDSGNVDSGGAGDNSVCANIGTTMVGEVDKVESVSSINKMTTASNSTKKMDLQIPVLNSLADVYAEEITTAQQKRYRDLSDAFTKRFGRSPEFYARSPGRVCIIGEHIDYSGYSVLPMAIARDVVIAVASTEEAPAIVTVTNINSEKYPDVTFTHDDKNIVEIDSTVGGNYFQCGYKGVFEETGAKGKSLAVMIDGNVPPGAGVSSSSAFVCSAALATMHAVGASVSKGRLTQTAIRSERYCGVQSGGMDQSASIMGTADSALLIHFHPKLAAEPIKFPPTTPSLVFIIANTLITANKHTTAPTNYNLRVVETLLAAAVLSKYLKVDHCSTLREVQERWVQKATAEGTFSGSPEGREPEILAKLLEVTNAAFKDGLYTREEAASALGMTVAEMEAKFVGSIVIRCEGFQLKKRTRHVFSEARRVYQFRDVCALKAPYSGNLLKDLGDLMNASHLSCKEDFNCSCPELDELTAICRQSGALGSRLTGAGWGGCTVSLVPEPEVKSFIKKVTEAYYYKHKPEIVNHPDKDALIADWIFASKPSSGAAILRDLKF